MKKYWLKSSKLNMAVIFGQLDDGSIKVLTPNGKTFKDLKYFIMTNQEVNMCTLGC